AVQGNRADVERALNASRLDREDMMALLSPAAADYLEPRDKAVRRN
ncbi:hypothetical protein L245_34360, partial [Salmonella enterica subsp. enterica serovar Worthington str. BCH-4719]